MQKSSGKVYLGEHAIHYYCFGKLDSKVKVYIQSQIHGNESFGTLVLYGLIDELSKIQKENILGFIKIIPKVNPYSWINFLYNHNGRFNDITGMDWNRSFYWLTNSRKTRFEKSKNIDLNEKISNIIFKLTKGFNYIWDIHTPENGIEHIYCQRFTSEISTFGIPNIIEFQTPTIHSLDEECMRLNEHSKNIMYIEALTIELPSLHYPTAKSGDIDHLNPVESDHLLSGAN